MIRLHLLGSVELTVLTDATPRTVELQSKRVALLAYLAMAKPSGFHRRDEVVGMFWPDLTQARARAALRKALHSLRTAVGARFIVARGDEEIALSQALVECDATEFFRRFEAGDLAGAMALYRGDFLVGFHLPSSPRFEHWADAQRTKLRTAAAGASIRLAEQAEARGDIGAAVRWARHAETLFPQREEIGRLVMSMLSASGDRSAALVKYAEIKRYLAEEFESEPSPETEALAQEIRSQTALARRPTPAHGLHVLSESFYRDLVETVCDVVYCCDMEGRFTYANRAGSQLLGLPSKDILGRLYLDFVREDHREEVLHFYLRQIHDQTPQTYLEFPMIRSDGATVWIGQNVQLVLRSGTLAGIQAVARDVTARRKGERVAEKIKKPRLQAG